MSLLCLLREAYEGDKYVFILTIVNNIADLAVMIRERKISSLNHTIY